MKYNTILIDPPWSNADSITKKAEFEDYPKGWPYQTMRLTDIASLPVRELASEQCHLYIWTMNSFVPHAGWLMQHWGFRYSQMITWVKPSGLGQWWVSRTQFILFGYNGKMRMRTKPLQNVFGATPERHSQKPNISYELIEQASFEPYLELFARSVRPGWHVWGDQVKSDIEIKMGDGK